MLSDELPLLFGEARILCTAFKILVLQRECVDQSLELRDALLRPFLGWTGFYKATLGIRAFQ